MSLSFRFQLEPHEVALLRSQIVTLNTGGAPCSRSQSVILKRGHNVKYSPYAFTEQGVAMLSSVLRSERAIQVNIAIMRIFVRMKEALVAHKELDQRLSELERKIEGHDEHIRTLFDAIRQLMNPPVEPWKQIGFHVREKRAAYGGRKSADKPLAARSWRKAGNLG